MSRRRLLIFVLTATVLTVAVILSRRDRFHITAEWASGDWKIDPVSGLNSRIAIIKTDAPALMPLIVSAPHVIQSVAAGGVPLRYRNALWLEIDPQTTARRVVVGHPWAQFGGTEVTFYVFESTLKEFEERMAFRDKNPWLRWLRPLPRERKITLA